MCSTKANRFHWFRKPLKPCRRHNHVTRAMTWKPIYIRLIYVLYCTTSTCEIYAIGLHATCAARPLDHVRRTPHNTHANTPLLFSQTNRIERGRRRNSRHTFASSRSASKFREFLIWPKLLRIVIGHDSHGDGWRACIFAHTLCDRSFAKKKCLMRSSHSFMAWRLTEWVRFGFRFYTATLNVWNGWSTERCIIHTNVHDSD